MPSVTPTRARRNDPSGTTRARTSDGAPSLSVIVFAYNEDMNVKHVLQDLLDWLHGHEPQAELVFIDDGSTDQTRAIAEQTLRTFSTGRVTQLSSRVIAHTVRQGIGAALKTGVAHAQGTWVTFLPADGQVPPSAIADLRAGAQDDTTRLVLSTYIRRDDGWHRKVLSGALRALIRAIHRVDMHSEGPYLFRREDFLATPLESDSFFLNFEFPIRRLRQGGRAAQVCVPCRPRQGGKSKSARLSPILAVAQDLARLRLKLWREHR